MWQRTILQHVLVRTGALPCACLFYILSDPERHGNASHSINHFVVSSIHIEHKPYRALNNHHVLVYFSSYAPSADQTRLYSTVMSSHLRLDLLKQLLQLVLVHRLSRPADTQTLGLVGLGDHVEVDLFFLGI